MHPLLACEVKARKKLPKWAADCHAQAATARGAKGKVPCVVLVEAGQPFRKALIFFEVGHFEELYGCFVDPPKDGDE